MIGVYKITNPKGSVYIGSSWNIKERFRQYKKYGAKRQPKLNNSFLKYGINNHVFEVLVKCDKYSTYLLEYKYQKEYNSINSGLNCNYVDINGNPSGHSKETKEKISSSLKGRKRPHTESTKLSISQAAKNKRLPKEYLIYTCDKHLYLKQAAEELNIRHTTLKKWLYDYGITTDTATFFKNKRYSIYKNDILTNYKGCKDRYELVTRCSYIHSHQSLDWYLKELEIKEIVSRELEKNKML